MLIEDIRLRLFLVLSVTYILELSPKEIEVIILYSKYFIFMYIVNELIITVNMKKKYVAVHTSEDRLPLLLLKVIAYTCNQFLYLFYSTTVMFTFRLGVRQNLSVDMVS